MSSRNRFPFANATSLTQEILNWCQDNLTNKLEAIIEIEAPGGEIIRASDRNKYVGEHFYEALTNFPEIKRTVGDWLGGGLEFPELNIEISNADGRFNKYLPGGASFAGWVNRNVVLKLGLRDVASSYFTVFDGHISEVGGFGRSVKSIVFRARDDLERVNRTFPTAVFSQASYPKADDEIWGTKMPVIYGDWTTDVTPGGASVPAIIVNGLDPIVNGEELNCTVAGAGSPAIFTYQNHRLNVGDLLEITDSNVPGITAGGTHQTVLAVTTNEFQLVGVNSTGAGQATVKKHANQAYRPVQCVIANNDLTFLGNVYLLRDDKFYLVPSALITVGSGNKSISITQDSHLFQIAAEHWKFNVNDKFYCLCKGKDLGSYDDNIVAQAKDLLKTFGGLVDGDFATSWTTYQNKASPSESAIANIKSRVWVQEDQNVMEYALSMLEQVRLEPFVNRSLMFDISSLHFDDFDPSPSFIISNWDVVKESLQPKIDDRNNFNRAQAAYGFFPILNENAYTSSAFRNNAAITQAGKAISRVIVFPNLYKRADVENQLKEILKLASAFREEVYVKLTPRSVLQDIGDFVTLDVQIGSSIFDAVPCLIREVSYVPGTLELSFRLWSMAMIPFGSYNPGYVGTVGGQTATITQE